MNCSYEDFYKLFHLLKKKFKKNTLGNVSDYNIDNLKLLEDCGFLIIQEDKFLFLEFPEKVLCEIDLFFYYKNFSKLNNIISQNNKIKFIFHYILFNITYYLSIEKLHKSLLRYIGKIIEIKIENLIEAHTLLTNSGIIKKDFCMDNRYFEDDGKITLYKSTWFYSNERIKRYDNIDIQIDYIQKLVTLRCVEQL